MSFQPCSFPPCQCKQTQLGCFGGCTQQLARSPGEHRTSPAPSWCPFWKHDLCSSLNAMAVISDCSSLHCPCLTQPRSIIPAEATGIFLHRSHWRSACILHGHIAHTFQNPAFIKKKKKKLLNSFKLMKCTQNIKKGTRTKIFCFPLTSGFLSICWKPKRLGFWAYDRS